MKMTTELDIYMKMIPKFVGRYIFSFLIVVPESIEFRDYRRTLIANNYRHSLKYEVAFKDNRLLENFMGVYLSRIWKKNGKHRYYLTTEKYENYCQECGIEGGRSEYCRGRCENEKWYDSKYAGKDIENALVLLFLNVKA